MEKRVKIGTIVKMLAYAMADVVDVSKDTARQFRDEFIEFRREMRDEQRAQSRNIDRILRELEDQGKTLQKVVALVPEDQRPTLRIQGAPVTPRAAR